MSGKITTTDIKTVGKVASSSGIFVPNDAQKQIKVLFWRRWNAGPVRTEDEITAAAIVSLTDSSAAENWWKDEGFRGWFKNQDSFIEDAEYNATLAIETIRQLMYNDNASVRLKAAQEALKLKDTLDKKSAESEENEMSADQMQKLFIKALNAGIIQLPKESSADE